MASFVAELRRRNVIKVAVAYGIVAWLLVQVSATVFPILQIPRWAVALVIVLLLLGFPIALVLAWAFELTPEGIKRTSSVPHAASMTRVTGRKLDLVIIALLVAVLGFMAIDRYMPERASETEVAPGELPAAAPSPQPQVLPNSVAVLPFENLSPDANNAYFAAGIHEELLNQLAKLRNLSVISRTSVLRYADSDLSIPEIAKQLNVGTVMEGSVRYADGRVRITTQLIDAKTDNHLWSETYDRQLDDVFSVESDIAMNIANALETEFSEAEQQQIEAKPTQNPGAYALYLSALSRGPSLDEAQLSIRDLDAAIKLDPNFASAYALRAWKYALPVASSGDLGGEGAAQESERNAVRDAQRALALDASIGLAHSALAAIDEVHWRWQEARHEAELAYELSPNDVDVLYQYTRFARNAADYEESIRAAERLVQLEPTAGNYNQLTVTQRYARHYDAAAAAAQRGVELAPAVPNLYVQLAYAEAARGNRAQALNALQVAEQLFGGNFGQLFRVTQMAMAYSQLGRRDDVQRLFSSLEALDRQTPVGEAVWAQAYLALGDYDKAYEQLAAALESPSPANYTTLVEIKANPWSLPELDTPRFRKLFEGFWSAG